MDKRYQVFVSSTFLDLVEERQVVMQALLEMNCIPAGMELFPAANDEAWKLIKQVIKQSDYYCLIISGRYGSTDEHGLSFTEREYDYAVKMGIPILAFLHKNPDSIPGEKTDRDRNTAKRLREFRTKVENKRVCKYWTGPEDLGAKVSRAMSQIFESTPRIGWVRADQVATRLLLADADIATTILPLTDAIQVCTSGKREVSEVRIFGLTAATIFSIIEGSQFEIGTGRILLTRFANPLPRSREEGINTRVQLYVKEWNGLKARGRIAALDIRYYNFFPSHYCCIFDKSSLLLGTYAYRKDNYLVKGSRAGFSEPIVITTKDPAQTRIIETFTKWFDDVFDRHKPKTRSHTTVSRGKQ